MSARPNDAGPPAATPAHLTLTVELACEACGEELLVAFPRERARYGAVDCPVCGSSYLFLLEPRIGADALPPLSGG